MITRVSLFALPALAAIMLAGVALGNPSGRTDLDQAKAANWNCDPEVLIVGYYHCAGRGSASVLDLVTGAAAPPSVQLRVFEPDGSFAGTETLLRADLYRGQPCPQDDLEEWDLLDLPVDYRACHNFDA
jgi:hypothetical protein